jgi:hypothetical protein
MTDHLSRSREHFRNATIEQLVAAFNSGVGTKVWIAARAAYLEALREALLATGLDCSSVISRNSMSQAHRIRVEGTRLVTVPDEQPPGTPSTVA